MTHTDEYPALDGNLSAISDGEGHAALLLVESLIHGLCEKAILTSHEAVAIVERAISVQEEYAEAADGDGAAMWRAHARLLSIAASLEIDSGGAAVAKSQVRAPLADA